MGLKLKSGSPDLNLQLSIPRLETFRSIASSRFGIGNFLRLAPLG